MLAVPRGELGRASSSSVRSEGRRGDGHRPVRADRPAGAEVPRRAGRPTSTWSSCTTAGRRWCAQADLRAAAATRLAADSTAERRTTPTTLLKHPRLAQRRQQGMDHPPVRPRGAGRQRRQAAGRRRRTTGRATRRCMRPVLGSRRGVVDRLRHEPALRRLRSVRHGRQRDRRGGAQLRRRRRRSDADRDPRQLLLGRQRAAGDARRAGAGGAGLPRRGARAAARRSSAARTASTTNSATPTRAAQRQTIAIPPSLLISAMGQIDDVAQCVTMDLKRRATCSTSSAQTKDELGGSHFALVNGLDGGQVPTVDPKRRQANVRRAASRRSTPAWCERATT